jgi:hypothetical protein
MKFLISILLATVVTASPSPRLGSQLIDVRDGVPSDRLRVGIGYYSGPNFFQLSNYDAAENNNVAIHECRAAYF